MDLYLLLLPTAATLVFFDISMAQRQLFMDYLSAWKNLDGKILEL
jgi:hypothetical protein